MSTWLDPLRAALDAAEAPVTFFFRDDDAGWEDDRLRVLLDLFAGHGLPLDLAVIPKELDLRTARELEARVEESAGRLGLHQHGFAHANHQPAGRACEFGPARSALQQRRDIERGRRRLACLLGPIVDPIFTPPWNRCTETTAACLAELGFETLSRESRATPIAATGLVQLDVAVDWFAKRKGSRLSGEQIGGLLADATAGSWPVGVMFHHAEMDETELEAAAELLRLLAAHPQARCERMTALSAVSSAQVRVVS